MSLPIEIPMPIPDWVPFAVYGLEFVVMLIAAIRLVRSEHHKGIGIALFVLLLAPIIVTLLQARVFGTTLTFIAHHMVTIVVLLMFLFTRNKRAQSDEFSL